MSLPSGYKRLEYIQSSGTQYVNSNFKANQDTRVVIDFEYISGDVVFGAYDVAGANGFGLQAASNKWYTYYGTSSAYSSTAVVANIRLVADVNKNVSTLNGAALRTATANTFSGANPLIISGLYNASAPGFLTALKIYSCQIYDNGTLVRDFIPCQTTDGTIGLWDDVNSVFYGNAGTGTFTAGPVVDPYGNDENTLLLLHGEDLTDSSQRNAQITNNGVIASDAQSKFGGKSLYFDGASNIAVNSPDFNFGLGDFTIDCWVRPEGPNGDCFLFSGASVNELFFGFMGNYAAIGIGRAGIAWDSSTYLTVPLEEWSHVTVVRHGTNTYFFLNGEIVFTCGNAVSYEIPSGLANVGSQGPNYYYKGYIDELRVSNVARWTEDFTPPTEPYKSEWLPSPANFRLFSNTEATATLAWDAVDGATGYKLYRDGVLIATLTDTSYTDAIQPFAFYVYTLTAYNDDGESAAAELTYCSIPENPILYLVTDRTESDVAYAKLLSGKGLGGMSDAEKSKWLSGLKGSYNASDLNRVESAVDYVAGRLQSFGNAVEVYTKKDWTTKDVPNVSAMKRYLNDVAALRAVLAVLPTTPEVPPDMDGLTYTDANNIEQILKDIDLLITNMTAAWFYSGDLYAGEV